MTQRDRISALKKDYPEILKHIGTDHVAIRSHSEDYWFGFVHGAMSALDDALRIVKPEKKACQAKKTRAK